MAACSVASLIRVALRKHYPQGIAKKNKGLNALYDVIPGGLVFGRTTETGRENALCVQAVMTYYYTMVGAMVTKDLEGTENTSTRLMSSSSGPACTASFTGFSGRALRLMRSIPTCSCHYRRVLRYSTRGSSLWHAMPNRQCDYGKLRGIRDRFPHREHQVTTVEIKHDGP